MLQECILNATPMADEDQALELLGLCGADPTAIMDREVAEGQILQFEINGRAAYPLFQFDIANRRVDSVAAKLIEMRPANWSELRLMYWLLQSNLDFDTAPAAALGSDDEAILSALKSEVEPRLHG